jgi:radical SAM superfamily enzyme YgiQ (UPF0313 family)
MRVSLSSSLHLDHGLMNLDAPPGSRPPMQAFVPVGLLSLKAAADHAGVDADVRVIELNGAINRGDIVNDDRLHEHIVDAIQKPGDDVVGLMTDADSLIHTLLIARRVKERDPRTRVCLGGPASSPIADVILQRFPYVDLVVRGEGEETFVDLLRALDRGRGMDEVAGLTWRDRERVIANPERPVAEVDDLPIPAWDAYEMTAGAPLYLDVGRGCPFRCRFCATAPFWRRRYRMKSTDRIVEEMSLVRNRFGRRHVNFSHDIFTCDRQWTLSFCERMTRESLGMTWSCSTRTDIIDPFTLERMAEAGCVEIYFGIESGSQETQQVIDKGLDLSWSREIVRATVAAGIRPVTGFIVGHPTETRETLADTLAKYFEFLEIGKVRAHLFTLCPFPEAPMYRQYAATVDRPAEYADLPMHENVAAEFYAMRDASRDVFVSNFRYSTPDVPEEWVDATEELSCHLVVLKALWPLLLPYYTSPLDWYEQWVQWIVARNDRYRTGTRFPHQGNAYDLLDFAQEELDRLGLAESDVAELVQYERLKLDARLLDGPLPRAVAVPPLGVTSVVSMRCRYLAQPFRYELAPLLAGHRVDEASAAPTWVVFAKTEDAFIDTLQTGARGKRLLDLAGSAPRAVSELAETLEVEFGTQPTDTFALVQSLQRRGYLEEVRP